MPLLLAGKMPHMSWQSCCVCDVPCSLPLPLLSSSTTLLCPPIAAAWTFTPCCCPYFFELVNQNERYCRQLQQAMCDIAWIRILYRYSVFTYITCYVSCYIWLTCYTGHRPVRNRCYIASYTAFLLPNMFCRGKSSLPVYNRLYQSLVMYCRENYITDYIFP